MSSDEKDVVKKRGVVKAKLTQFTTFFNQLKPCQSLSDTQIAELTCRLSKMDSLYDEYDALQMELELMAVDPASRFAEREQFEVQYYGIISASRALLDSSIEAAAAGKKRQDIQVGSDSSGGVANTVQAMKQNLVKLPKIDLAPFDGDYHHWLEFKDTFMSLIHNSDQLDDISKFHYLRRSLKGSAELVISNLDFSSSNYSDAWSLLCERFDNKRLLVNNHVHALFNLAKIEKESSKSLRHLVDSTNKCLRALSTLGEPVKYWDTLIIHMMTNRLDHVTNRQWEEFRNNMSNTPILKDFMTYISSRADLLETLEESSINSKLEAPKQKSFIVATEERNNVSGQTKKCPMCDNNHALYSCPSFRTLDVETRNQKVNDLNVCEKCLNPGHLKSRCRYSNCRYCRQKHNTLLCNNKAINIEPSNVALSSDVMKANTDRSSVLLSTALVKVIDHQGKLHTARLLLDNGSTANFITQRLCGQLGLVRRNIGSTVSGINNQSSQSAQSCDLTIVSSNDNYRVNINCYIIAEITKLLPSSYVNTQQIKIPAGIQLADPTYNVPSAIDILVGAEVFWSILGTNTISLGTNQPNIRETKLGWVVTGSVNQPKQAPSCHFIQTEVPDLTRFWELDAVTSTHCMSQEERACEQSFKENTTRDDEGRFEVTIPLKDSPQALGESYHMAKIRFLSLERRFERDALFKRSYNEFVQEYIDLGHMTENKVEDKDIQSYFLPHHGVLRESSSTTKLRVVFDASAVTKSGKSFNDIQMVGPTIQEDLLSILLRFREHKYVVTSDIEKMYRAINVVTCQRPLQQIIYRSDSSEPLRTYTLNTLTYGTSSAPYLATKCLVSLADEATDENVKMAIKRNFYVDDFLSGGQSKQSVIELCRGVIAILDSAKFNLRKWQSNNSEILQEISDIKGQSEKCLNLSNQQSCKTLGLNWACQKDILLFTLNLEHKSKITKRHILSIISQIFDPLGLVGPCIVEAKLILQRLWVEKCEWDDEVPIEIRTRWVKLSEALPCLNHLQIPRWVVSDIPICIEIHTFTDASESAYGACIYVRTVTNSGTVTVHLLVSKNKVAPIKHTTIPRLELCAALLGTRLCTKVTEALTIKFSRRIYWCDSTIVLGWLTSSPAQLEKFVQNRVCEIQESTNGHKWSYVPSKENPADLVSRGVMADLIGDSQLWWSGPSYLRKSEQDWPKMPNVCKNPHVLSALTTDTAIDQDKIFNDLSLLIKNTSVFSKLVRIFAFLMRFIHNSQKINMKLSGPLSITELESAECRVLHIAQKEMFPTEYPLILAGKSLPSKNRLLSLTPFFDNHKIMRVGGRLNNSFYDYSIKHPILLCSKHHLTKILFSLHHKRLHHAGPQLLLSNVRHAYWPLGGRNLAKLTVHTCVKCHRLKATPVQPIMGNLPNPRVHLEYPFIDTGVDYCGPVMISDRKGRGSRLIKSYICVFVCLAVKAIHIELVTDLTKEAFLAALYRFISRRGRARNIYADNGVSFVGGSNELARFLNSNSSAITNSMSQDGISFKFIPPYSPHFGGIWEAAVKSVKHHLRRVLGLAHLNYEEMTTCLTQIEAILNSRPLTPLSTDPTDLSALTPGHFLIGRSLTSVPHPQVTDVNILRLKRYQRVESLRQHFWNRYYTEYISLLQQKAKWHKSSGQLSEGALVIIKDKGLPPLLWKLGRITRVHTGTDGVARIADILTTRGTVQRSFNSVCPLPLF